MYRSGIKGAWMRIAIAIIHLAQIYSVHLDDFFFSFYQCAVHTNSSVKSVLKGFANRGYFLGHLKHFSKEVRYLNLKKYSERININFLLKAL